MTLEILICTFNDRIAQVPRVLMQPMHNVSYLVSWQQSEDFAPGELPQELLRDDVRVVTVKGLGSALNRNNAIANASADLCLMADDDIEYFPNSIARVFEVFELHPSLDIATFKYTSRNYPKQYPSYSFDLRKPAKNYYVNSFEFAFRRKSVQGVAKFNKLFGVNAPLISCEEPIFLMDAFKHDLNCFFFPYVICRHDHATTAERLGTHPGHLMANGAYIYLAYKDGTAPLRYILFAWRSCRNIFKFPRMLHHVLQGVKYIKAHRNEI